MNEWVAISLILGTFSLLFTWIMSIIQTNRGKMAHTYWTKYRNRYWIVLFNASSRAIIHDDLYKQFCIRSADYTAIQRCRIISSKRVESPKLRKVDNVSQLEFEYMRWRAFIIIEIVLKPGKEYDIPWIDCVFRDGDFDDSKLWVGKLMHSGIWAILILGLLEFVLIHYSINNDAQTTTFKIWFFSSMILCGLLLTCIDMLRRISTKDFRKACREIKKRKRHFHDCLKERRVELIEYKIESLYKWWRNQVRRSFKHFKRITSSLLSYIRRLFFRISIHFKRAKKQRNEDG